MKWFEDVGKYALLSCLIILFAIGILMIIGPTSGSTISVINTCQGTCTPPAMLTPTFLPAPTQPVILPTAKPFSTPGTQASVSDQLAEIDKLLSQSMVASLAYNAPSSMNLDDTTTIELLLNQSLSPTQIAGQVTQPGQVVNASVEVTPRMRAELFSEDKDAFVIRSIQISDEQVISGTDTTRWSWYVTARKSGQQNLTLVVYRLVKFDGQDYWPEVQSYQADINVKVTLGSRLRILDWKWMAGTFVTAVIIPAFWRWVDRRKKRHAYNTSAKHKKKG